MRHIALLVVVVLLIVAASLGYAYHRENVNVGYAKSSLIYLTNNALLCLSNVESLSTMAKYNASVDAFTNALYNALYGYSICVQVLSQTSSTLYQLTGEKKYLYLNSVANNLNYYFDIVNHGLMFHPDKSRDELIQDGGILTNISNFVLYTICRKGCVQNMSIEEAEKLNNLTAELFNATAMEKQALQSVEQLANQTS